MSTIDLRPSITVGTVGARRRLRITGQGVGGITRLLPRCITMNTGGRIIGIITRTATGGSRVPPKGRILAAIDNELCRKP